MLGQAGYKPRYGLGDRIGIAHLGIIFGCQGILYGCVIIELLGYGSQLPIRLANEILAP